MIAFETEVRIERPLEEVFDYVSNPRNLPHWNSAVRAARTNEGATYSIERELPTGRATNGLEIVGCERPRAFSIRTISGPTPFHYRYAFSAQNGTTVVQLAAEVELPAPASFLPQLARRSVKNGVDDSFRTLKDVLERPPQRSTA